MFIIHGTHRLRVDHIKVVLPELSISPQQSEVNFNADGTPDGNVAFTVSTNQSEWNVKSNKAWLTVNKTISGFTITAAINTLTIASEPAIVIVSAGEAIPIEILVTQAPYVFIPQVPVFSMISVQGGITILNDVTVTLSSFQIGKYEVTQKQWYEVMGSWPAVVPSVEFGLGNNYPIYNVSYDDVQLFLEKLNQQTGKNYRLPTEAEWEYAAKGGQITHNYVYSGTNNIEDVVWYRNNTYDLGYGGTREVGRKAPNELGIYDMSGNVLEWCHDWYGHPYPSSTNNPGGSSYSSIRVIRGGSWGSYASQCTVAARDSDSQEHHQEYVGFRLALSL
ncbi:MAG: SUMF1/EgtB/PvdO family nonheme iron enzyme [Bacteroidales bacterium]|nr:SUMF1/EgtB/PvdO family nonheme iron enzyme [Bacteroidales bacterium]